MEREKERESERRRPAAVQTASPPKASGTVPPLVFKSVAATWCEFCNASCRGVPAFRYVGMLHKCIRTCI